MHKPIQFKDLSLSFPHKTCFSDFSGQILYGSRIAIIGRNGKGKSTLLKLFQGTWEAYGGELLLPNDLRVGYLPQLIESYDTLSGGERLNQALTEALCQNPNLLLLDEPTNHLDKANRRSLIKYLNHYVGTLIMVTHDLELLKNLADTIWHIQHGKVVVFHGNYDDYQRIQTERISSIEQELAELKSHKKEAHFALMREQGRNKKMRARGEKNIAERKWPTIRSSTKLGNAVKTGDKRLHKIQERKQHLIDEKSALYQHEKIEPKFQLEAAALHKATIIIRDATVRFVNGPVILQKLNFQVHPKERVALCGDNGAGKSTLIKAILQEEKIEITGEWSLPPPASIGYLDQHYQNLHCEKTAFEMIASIMPNAPYTDIRKHLNDFLFRKNEEINTPIINLSGGEKARLSLCCIAASPPALLILDEMTNNLDLETRAHVIDVLKNYLGTLIVISHDECFLKAIGIESMYLVHQGLIERITYG